MTLPEGVRLRWSTPADAEAGAALHRACWRAAYSPLVDRAALEQRLAATEAWDEAWRRSLEERPRLLAEYAGRLVGFALAGPTRDADAVAPLELWALYTAPDHWGTGLGEALLDAVLPREAGPACLWTLEANARAQAFYRRHGFVVDGGRKRYEPLRTWEVRMVRGLVNQTVDEGRHQA